MVVDRDSAPSCRTEAEQVFEEGDPNPRSFSLTRQSPFISTLISQLEMQLKGEGKTKSGKRKDD